MKGAKVIPEIWKPIPGTKGYRVSNKGRVRSPRKILKTGKLTAKRRYHDVEIHGKTRTVHRLVAEAFIPNPENLPEVNHKDHSRANNRATNLEWCTHLHNIQHAAAAGRMKSRQSKLSDEQGEELLADRQAGMSYSELAHKYGISKHSAYQRCKVLPPPVVK